VQVSCREGKYLASALGGVGQLVKLLLVSPAQSFLSSSLVEIHEYFYLLLDMYLFRSGKSSSTSGGVGLSRASGVMKAINRFCLIISKSV
jgi:hypothetical protein